MTQLTRKQKAEAARERADFEAVLGTPEGRRVLLWVLDRAQVYSVVTSADARAHVNEGRRSVGLQVISMLMSIRPTAYADLLMTRVKLEEHRDATREEEDQGHDD